MILKEQGEVAQRFCWRSRCEFACQCVPIQRKFSWRGSYLEKLVFDDLEHTILMRRTGSVFFFAGAAALSAVAANDTEARLGRAVVLSTMTESGHGIPPEELANTDCIGVIPGFKKGAAVVGVGYGRGFLSCRTGAGWSAPSAISPTRNCSEWSRDAGGRTTAHR